MSQRPLTIVLATGLQSLIALALLLAGGYVLIEVLLGRATDVGYALPLTVFALGAGAAVGYTAWGLFMLHSWARTPVVLTQIFVCVIAYYMWTSQQYAISVALAVVAAAALVLALAPSTTARLFPGESGRHDRQS
ncbi:hypothetical protein [Salinactinospora qingdaonensis]|uniref:Integral membrane protein n=1 Tax=Salinactinospora qingdaonensis TaxID=702744 RepID=A0ABP7G7G5_9ACTN